MNETLTTENGRTVLRMERALRHQPEKVWRALTEPKELDGWFPAAVELDLRLDGPISFTFPDEEANEGADNAGVIRAYEPPRLLEYNWGSEILRWELVPTADGCLLKLTAIHDDRPGSASFTAGWIRCLDALDRVLGGSSIPREHYALLHEHFVKAYGLDQGIVDDDGSIHFERQLTAPKEQVWQALTDPAFVAEGIESGQLLKSEEPVELTYEWQQGTVTWHLRDGNGGARLKLTQTGPAQQYLKPWHDLIESLAADLATTTAAAG
ncbi:SRPBCC domain-containing protein [Kribbella sp. NPDC023855]|uniref:SRPBCC domain-containing protein n=1 Tax=Kribbella sp. NPDC023855 TaxID=3154698 RepID=UPI0033D25D41